MGLSNSRKSSFGSSQEGLLACSGLGAAAALGGLAAVLGALAALFLLAAASLGLAGARVTLAGAAAAC